ncbi:MAG: heme exporter protein CcmB [Proteobacteria bacterium]|nr:heme exporter protein CcmB [Pseudomonadota bacterium]
MIRRELRNLYLHGGTLLATFSFFVFALFCIALTLGPHENILKQSAPALIWILAILSTLFSTPLLLKAEAKEGLLDEILLHPSSPAFYLLSKTIAECILFGLPLIVVGACLSSFFLLPYKDILTLSLTLLIGFPALSSLGILGGLLTIHSQGGGLLIALLILPLTLPLLLFGLAVMEMVRLGLDSSASFCLLTGVALLLVIISITASSWALRFAIEG